MCIPFGDSQSHHGANPISLKISPGSISGRRMAVHGQPSTQFDQYTLRRILPDPLDARQRSNISIAKRIEKPVRRGSGQDLDSQPRSNPLDPDQGSKDGPFLFGREAVERNIVLSNLMVDPEEDLALLGHQTVR